MIKFVMCAKRHPNLSQTDFQDRQNTIALRPIRVEDIAAIKSWPIYVDGFEQMDYALREHGWLDEFWQKPDTWIYIAELNKQVTGFSLLSTTSEGAAEFRIAIHPLWTGKGLGKKITVATLKTGFRQLNLNHVHLIVRKNNSRAAKLYESLDFAYTGESIHTIQGKRIEFKDMAMTKQRFNNLDNEED